MSYMKDVFGKDLFSNFDRHFIGFDPLWDRMRVMQKQLAQTTYPPYSIRKESDNKYLIEMAVAGFGKQDLEIELVDNKLTIRGKHKPQDSDNYLFKGLATRNFEQTFTLDDHVMVKGATMLNGILKIALESLVPQKRKVQINIEDEPLSVSEIAASNPQLLTEGDVLNTENRLK